MQWEGGRARYAPARRQDGPSGNVNVNINQNDVYTTATSESGRIQGHDATGLDGTRVGSDAPGGQVNCREQMRGYILQKENQSGDKSRDDRRTGMS